MKATIRVNRLKKLADHLINGKLGHERFIFHVYNHSIGEYDKNGCGTAGCAIGECPIIFTEWCFGKHYSPKLKSLKGESNDIEEISGRKFFGLNNDQYDHLFVPNNQLAKYGDSKLGDTATSKMVGNNILKFIEVNKS